jgi:hypothetical protein
MDNAHISVSFPVSDRMRDGPPSMKCCAWSTVALLWIVAGPAAAKDAGQEAYMSRVLVCDGTDARMEIYLPQSAEHDDAALVRSVIGYYTLDLSELGKGKPLEPVRVSLSADKKWLIVNQYTRKLPPTRIPIGGGTVDFDRRFGTGAKCGAFREHD